MAFTCPVCACVGYIRVVVPRPNGKRYETSFHACANCTTMFLDPDRYSRDRVPKVIPLAPDFRLLWPKLAAEGAPGSAVRLRGRKQRR